MEKAKINKVNVRLSDKEKNSLEKRALQKSMSLSQYIRYKILATDDEVIKDNINESIIKQLPLIMRILISGYLKIGALSDKQLDTKEVEKIKQRAIDIFIELGIAKENGSNDQTNI